jgi:hypothetical protein
MSAAGLAGVCCWLPLLATGRHEPCSQLAVAIGPEPGPTTSVEGPGCHRQTYPERAVDGSDGVPARPAPCILVHSDRSCGESRLRVS